MGQNTLLNLRKFLAPEIVYGEGALELAGRHARNLGASKVMLVSDPGVAEHGWTSRVENSLRQAGIDLVRFTNVSPNPKDYEVKAGAERYREQGCDLIVAVGGGSPMDCAKGIGVVATNGGSILDYQGINEIPRPVPPLIFIPTTAGTSADISQFAIITDSRRGVKVAIVSKMVIPDIALVDPTTTVTMPPDLTAATGMDALCHAFEAYVSTASSPITDMAAESAVKLVYANLAGAFRQPKEMKYRGNMMMASLMAGLAFSNASLGIVHALAHCLGGAFDLAHGECNAMLLEKVVAFNYQSAAAKYDRLAPLIGVDLDYCAASEKPARITAAIAELRYRLGITERLAERGITLDQLSRLAEAAAQDPCVATNPREPTVAELENLYRSIY